MDNKKQIEYIARTAAAEPAESLQDLVADMLGHKAGGPAGAGHDAPDGTPRHEDPKTQVNDQGGMGPTVGRVEDYANRAKGIAGRVGRVFAENGADIAALASPLVGAAIGGGVAGRGRRMKGAAVGAGLGAAAGLGIDELAGKQRARTAVRSGLATMKRMLGLGQTSPKFVPDPAPKATSAPLSDEDAKYNVPTEKGEEEDKAGK